MSTLEELINRKKQSEGYKQEDYASEQADEKDLLSIIGEKDFQITQDDMGQFSKEDILAAAKFTVRARAYGIKADVDASDSPIYYKSKNVSRFFMKRKKIRDKAAAVVEKAKGILAKRREAVENLRKKNEQVDQMLDEFSFDEKITEIAEEYKENSGYADSLNESETFKCIDKVIENQQAMTAITGGLQCSEAEDNAWREGHKGQRINAIVKKELDGVDAALSEKLPTAEEMKQIISQKLKEKLKIELMAANDPKAKMQEIEKSYSKTAERIFSKIDRMYKEVSEGKLSPDVVKLFLRTDLMAHKTGAESDIYDGLVGRTEKVNEPTLKEISNYKDGVFSLVLLFNTDSCVKIQKNGEEQRNIRDAYSKLPQQKKLNKEIKTLDDEKEAKRVVIDNTTEYIHFRGRLQTGRVNPDSKTTRYYVTAKPGKQAQLVKIWNDVLSKEYLKKDKNGDSLVDKLYFKLRGTINDSRRDNIVIYQGDEISDAEMKSFLDAFYDECKNKDVLADKQDTLVATIKAHDYERGITTAPEFDTKIYDDFINYGLFTDVKLDKELSGALNKKSTNDVTKPKFSYNNFIAKAMLYSSKIICKNHGFSYDVVVDKVKNEPAIKTEFKMLISGFMKLGGVDINTMKRTEVIK